MKTIFNLEKSPGKKPSNKIQLFPWPKFDKVSLHRSPLAYYIEIFPRFLKDSLHAIHMHKTIGNQNHVPKITIVDQVTLTPSSSQVYLETPTITSNLDSIEQLWPD